MASLALGNNVHIQIFLEKGGSHLPLAMGFVMLYHTCFTARERATETSKRFSKHTGVK